MEYGLILVLGITIGVSMMIPIAASMIKQKERKTKEEKLSKKELLELDKTLKRLKKIMKEGM